MAARQCRAQSPAGQALERVNLHDGRHYEGYVESEDDGWVFFIQIQRKAGQPMHLVIRTLDRRSVASIAPLDAPQRAKLRDEIERFVNRAAIESGRMEAVALAPLDKDGNRYQHYAGKWFALDSTADERTTRRVIVRVEQIFAAYRQTLSPRNNPPQPPRLVVFASMQEYQAFLAARELSIQNTACFIEGENVVAVGSELARLAVRMAKVNAQTDDVRRELQKLERRLPDRLRELAEAMRKEGRTSVEIARATTMEKRQFDDDVKAKKKELWRWDRDAAQTFNDGTRQMFARVYHESFHAYLENYVFPHAKCDVPRWLNEGLAVMFEGGILEADALRVDAPNAVALKKLKADLSGPQPLPLQQLLSSDAAAFVQVHGSDAAASDRYYAAAWGVAYFLAFEKHLLDSPGLLQYVEPDAKKMGPAARFEKLVGMPLNKFEKEWRQYILSLK
jgi:hypothetical protein